MAVLYRGQGRYLGIHNGLSSASSGDGRGHFRIAVIRGTVQTPRAVSAYRLRTENINLAIQTFVDLYTGQ